MQATTNDTSKKAKDGRAGNGGQRKGAGRKPAGKKYGQYYMKVEIVDRVASMENPSQFVEEQLKKAIARMDRK